jgi:hypothetical protein
MNKQVVIAGGKYDGPDKVRLKLHEEYGRVWLYVANEDGSSKQNGRLLCIDDDGYVRFHAQTNHGGMLPDITIEWPE